MGLPSKKRPKSEKRKRATVNLLQKAKLTTCPKCKKAILPYHVCPYCGTYAGRQVLKLEIKKETKK